MLGGSNHSATYNFAGDIDELRLFPFDMMTAQIQAQMAAPNQETAEWHLRNFGPGAVDWSADSDGDELDRLGEYAFGGNPHVADREITSPSVSLNPSTQRLATTFTRRSTGSHSLLYKLEVSADLLDWVYKLEVSADLLDWDTLTATEINTAMSSPEQCLEQVTMETGATSAQQSRQFTRASAVLAE